MSNWKPIENVLFDHPLPDGYALCVQVGDEPITAQALERDGWEVVARLGDKDGEISDMRMDFGQYSVSFSLEHMMTWCYYSNIFGDESMSFSGVKTMSDLRTLVRLLGGDA